MLFLIDAQLPPALAEALRAEGHDAIHVANVGLLTATDAQIWNEAAARSAVLISKDRDFALHRAARNSGPVVLWIRLGNTDNPKLIAQVVRALPAIIEAVTRGETVIELAGHLKM